MEVKSLSFDTVHLKPCGHEVCVSCMLTMVTLLKKKPLMKCPCNKCKVAISSFLYRQNGAKYEFIGNLDYRKVEYCAILDPVQMYLQSKVQSREEIRSQSAGMPSTKSNREEELNGKIYTIHSGVSCDSIFSKSYSVLPSGQ